MVDIKLPEEEAWAFYNLLQKVTYESVTKCCRREPAFGSGRRTEDVAWAARSLILEQIKSAISHS